jgi:TM2 domain-containing membrane protein YozV
MATPEAATPEATKSIMNLARRSRVGRDSLLGVSTPPYGHDPYALPTGPAQPEQQPAYPVSGTNAPDAYSPAALPPYGQPAALPPYGQPVSGLPQPYAGYPQSPYPQSPYPMGYAVTGAAGYGYDPVTGQPLSDKSKVVAGLLQLLLGALFGLGGVGRLYAGNVGLGVTQLVLSVLGWFSFWCGFVLFLPFAIFVGLWIWFIVDGIVMLAGRPVDGQGRLLRA